MLSFNFAATATIVVHNHLKPCMALKHDNTSSEAMDFLIVCSNLIDNIMKKRWKIPCFPSRVRWPCVSHNYNWPITNLKLHKKNKHKKGKKITIGTPWKITQKWNVNSAEREHNKTTGVCKRRHNVQLSCCRLFL